MLDKTIALTLGRMKGNTWIYEFKCTNCKRHFYLTGEFPIDWNKGYVSGVECTSCQDRQSIYLKQTEL